MKRGLAILNLEETPREAFAERLNAVRDHAKASGAQVAVIYADVSRSGDINYLTNLCLYWNEALLAVPLEGKPALITKLSKRVQPWMKTTSILEDIRSTPKLAEGVGKFLDERCGSRAAKVGIVDMQWWPSPLANGLQELLPQARLLDMPGGVSTRRGVPDQYELRLLQQAASLLDQSIEKAWAQGADGDERTGIAVRSTRMAGFQDADVRYRALTDGSQCIDVVGQYRYVWVRLARAHGGAAADAANAALATMIRQIRAGRSERQIIAAANATVDQGYRCKFSCISHPYVETRGYYRPSEDADTPLQAGQVVCASVSLAGEAGVVTASDMYTVTDDGVGSIS
ncbi:MAG: hypothetical protein LBE59_05100 [Nevskiaceae bacterium]|jgi:Xaa-Pro aminopeptidase|nr:hypothetical protein [Nevskiaceae bacterium]